jgi:tetratricopeptide (TPR) repeat protein
MAESQREEITKLEALYADNPGGRVFVHLAEAYRKAGEHERAREVLAAGLSRHPDAASGHVVLGRVLADLGDHEEATAAYRRVLELDGGNLVALHALADLARDAGETEEARAQYGELLLRDPSSDEARVALADLAEREGERAATQQRDEADRIADEAVSAAPATDASTTPAGSGEYMPADHGDGAAHASAEHDAPADDLPLTQYDDAWLQHSEAADTAVPADAAVTQPPAESVQAATLDEPPTEFRLATPGVAGETGEALHAETDYIVADAAALPGDLAALAGLGHAPAESVDDDDTAAHDELTALDLAARGEPELDLDMLRESRLSAPPHEADDTGLILAATPLDPDVFDTSELLDLVSLQAGPAPSGGEPADDPEAADLGLSEVDSVPTPPPDGHDEVPPFAGAVDELEIIEALIGPGEDVSAEPDPSGEPPQAPWLPTHDTAEPATAQEPEPAWEEPFEPVREQASAQEPEPEQEPAAWAEPEPEPEPEPEQEPEEEPEQEPEEEPEEEPE